MKILNNIEERINLFLEKNCPTDPGKWSASKSAAKRKFDVYPSAYANGWAAKNYKSKGGGWRTCKESVEINEADTSDIIKDLDKVKNDLIKKVDILIAKKKKLYSDVDITTPMSADEKKLNKDIADLFSQIQQLILQKRNIKEGNTNGLCESCWDGYQQVGMKEKGGKMVPNCVPVNENINENFPDMSKWWKEDKSEIMSFIYFLKRQLPPSDKKRYDEAWKEIVQQLQKRTPAPKSEYEKLLNQISEEDEYPNHPNLRDTDDEVEYGYVEPVEYDVESEDDMKDFIVFIREYNKKLNEDGCPCVFEAEYQGRKVKLGKPMAGDVKKFKVYVKNDKGNVVKVNFGQKGVKIKKSNPDRRRSFRARHNCDNPGPRWKARYWSCRKW